MKQWYLIVFLLFFVLSTANGQNYYVSTTGNNNNPGTLLLPFKTIQHAADVAIAGSTVYVKGGTYPEHVVTATNSGTASAPILFKPYNSNDTVYIDGGSAASIAYSELWRLKDVNYITIDGFVFQNQMDTFVIGLIVRPGCNHITITNCTFRNLHYAADPAAIINDSFRVASPISAWGESATEDITNITFSNNKIYNCRTGYGEGMTFAGNVDTFLAYGNYIHHVGNIGINAGGNRGTCPDPAKDQPRNGVISYNVLHDCISPIAAAGQIYSDGGKDLIIEHNVTAYGTIGIALNCEIAGKTASNIIIRDNIIYKNTLTGINIAHNDSVGYISKVIDAEITGNTCYSNNTDTGVWAGEMNIVYAEDLKVHNNIFFSNSYHNIVYNYYDSNGTGNMFDYNIYYARNGVNSSYYTYSGMGYFFPDYQLNTGQDAHSIFADPKFFDTTAFDFHLKPTSPALNAGDPLYTAGNGETDLDGQARIFGNVIDCGADEIYCPSNFIMWIGPSGGLWGNAANWSCGALPGVNDDVLIPGGKLVKVSTAGAVCHNLSILATSTIEFTATSSVLHVYGSLDNNGAIEIGPGHLKVDVP